MLVLALIWWAWSAFVWAANATDPDGLTLRVALVGPELLVGRAEADTEVLGDSLRNVDREVGLARGGRILARRLLAVGDGGQRKLVGDERIVGDERCRKEPLAGKPVCEDRAVCGKTQARDKNTY